MSTNYMKHIKSILGLLGIEGLVRTLYHKLGIPAILEKQFDEKYGNINRFQVSIHGLQVSFSTKDDYSKHWFFPRYDGGKLHERPVTLLVSDEVKNSRCFVDVGTNLGWYTCLASKLMPDGIVYGFEIDDFFCPIVRKNLEMNGCRNATIYHAAVTDTPGWVNYVNNSRELPSEHGGVEPGKATQVEAITLDDFFRDKSVMPDIVKIDVEGAETKVLRGMENTIENNAPKLFVEVHTKKLPLFQSSADEVLAFLINNGYKVFEIEHMRRHSASMKTRRLSAVSHLPRNTMLYAYK